MRGREGGREERERERERAVRNPPYPYRVSFADFILFKIIAASLMYCHLTGLASVTLATKTPYTILTLVTESHLEPLGHKCMAIDPTNLFPPPRSTTVIDTHCRKCVGGRGV